MKILKNKLFISIISCFLVIITIFSYYSLPKAKASQTELDWDVAVGSTADCVDFNIYDSYPTTISSYVDLAVGVDLKGTTIYFSTSNLEHSASIFFDKYKIVLHSVSNSFSRLSFCIYELFDDGTKELFCLILSENEEVLAQYGCFSLNTSFFPENTNFVVTNIDYFLRGDTSELDFVDFDILISPSSIHNFSDWIDEVPATETNKGVKGHYTCSHCNKYFNENYVEISNLDIPIKTDKPNNGGFSASGVSSGSSCSSASIYGIFGIAIVFSFVAFAISHITKRKKQKGSDTYDK